VGPFIASTLTPFALGFAFGGYAFDHYTLARHAPAPAHSVGTSGHTPHATGVGVGP